MEMFLLAILVMQLTGLALVARAGSMGSRPPILKPWTAGLAASSALGRVSVVIPTLNEVHRLGNCLSGLAAQGYPVREILVVDSCSRDGTRELVIQATASDPRLRLLTDDALPAGWVGRPWALHHGFLHSAADSEWVLGMDADVRPLPGLVASLVACAQTGDYDLLSLGPRFILRYPGECWLHPALLVTLLLRTSTEPNGQSVLANGQCFLCRRAVLAQLGGYTSAKGSFSDDDVTLARYAAARGFRVRFMDGSRLLRVRMYEGGRETWREWGRSIDLKDAYSPGQLWRGLYVLMTLQALPLPLLAGLLAAWYGQSVAPWLLWAALGLNAALFAFRVTALFVLAPSYDRSVASGSGWYWLSPLADLLAVLRIWLSAFRRPTQWRGRQYASGTNPTGG